MIGPFLLTELANNHINPTSLDSLKGLLGATRTSQITTKILQCWISMANANALCFAAQIPDYDALDEALYTLADNLIKALYQLILLYNLLFLFSNMR